MLYTCCTQGACVISNNTAAAIAKAKRLIDLAQMTSIRAGLKSQQFMLTIDEADDFYRTAEDDKPINLVKELNELKGCGPLVTFEVSATLLAIYMVCQRSGGAANVLSNDIFYVDPGTTMSAQNSSSRPKTPPVMTCF